MPPCCRGGAARLYPGNVRYYIGRTVELRNAALVIKRFAFVGMLFVDFEHPNRLRLNGAATVDEAAGDALVKNLCCVCVCVYVCVCV